VKRAEKAARIAGILDRLYPLPPIPLAHEDPFTLLVAVVRPLNVLVSTLGSDLRLRDKLFLGAIAPRGIVAAAVATLVAGSMQAAGVAGGSELRALVFLTIAGTVALAALLGLPLARLLSVQAPPRDAVAILGAEGLGIELGTRLREASIPVLFIDANPLHCRAAEEAGFPVTFGNALDERTLALARFDRVRSAVGLTSNESLNSLFARFAREEFEVPDAWIALDPKSSAIAERHVGRWEARVLFDEPKDVERWNVRLRHRQAVLEKLVFRGVPEQAGADGAEAPGVRVLDSGTGHDYEHKHRAGKARRRRWSGARSVGRHDAGGLRGGSRRGVRTWPRSCGRG